MLLGVRIDFKRFPAVERDSRTKFTCFTSAKVQILNPPDRSERESPASEDWLFIQAGLSKHDLDSKGIVVFTVKWPR